MALTQEQEFTRRCAVSLRQRGLNPLPSRQDMKRPWMSDSPAHDRYAMYWEQQLPEEMFTEDGWKPTRNLQLMTGRHWQLMAIDLDGPEAIDQWKAWTRTNKCPKTWVTHSGGGGRHIWFRLPPNMPDRMPKGELWRPTHPAPRKKGETAIERLCDQSIVMFPPSIHPETGVMYRFIDERSCPPTMSLPAPAPRWVLDLKPLKSVRESPAFVPPPLKPRYSAYSTIDRADRDEVLAAIPDLVGVAKTWGLRVAGSARETGWVPVHAFDREDTRASAAIHRRTGVYTDRGTGASISFFDLMVAMGRAHDFQDAVTRLAERRF